MPYVDINQAVASDLTTQITDISVDSQTTDAAGDQKETEWQMSDYAEWLGYYKEIPELQTAIDAKANWTMGAGFTADEPTTLLLLLIITMGIHSQIVLESMSDFLKGQIISLYILLPVIPIMMVFSTLRGMLRVEPIITLSMNIPVILL